MCRYQKIFTPSSEFVFTVVVLIVKRRGSFARSSYLFAFYQYQAIIRDTVSTLSRLMVSLKEKPFSPNDGLLIVGRLLKSSVNSLAFK
jgi:hypothetical protein